MADSSKALIEGRSIGTALTEGAINVPVALGGEMSKKILEPLLAKVAVPVALKVVTDSQQVLAKLPSELGKKILEDRTKKALQGAIKEAAKPNLHNGSVISPRPSLADALSVEDDLLLKFAIVDMSKGVGCSWW